MNVPYSVSKKTLKKGKETSETEWVKNSDIKKDFIEKFGIEKFNQAVKNDPKRWGKFIEPEFPKNYRWLWFVFLDIWSLCDYDMNGNKILTPRVLCDYCECFKISLTIQEKRIIFKMKTWANDEIYSLREKDKG